MLTAGELVQASGGRTQPRRQLTELRRRGFWRAQLNIRGGVDLERTHYEAVCRGALQPGVVGSDTSRPALVPVAAARKAA